MKSFIGPVIDLVAVLSACWLTDHAFGFPWGLVGIVGVALYAASWVVRGPSHDQ